MTTYEEGCTAFKAAHSSLKKVMEMFPVDGYVTEHILAVQDLSRGNIIISIKFPAWRATLESI